jgi:signal peptidase I
MIFAAVIMAVTFITGLISFLDLVFLKAKREPGEKEGKIVEYSKSFFPVLLAVFIIRSFVVEPFKIPSGSMMPTLINGDFIAVNKFSYGLRLPVFHKTLIKIGSPNRGDVVVFNFPDDPKINYIKRLIGLPGDEIRYENKQLFIDGTAIEQEFNSDYLYDAAYGPMNAKLYYESVSTEEHGILIHDVPDKNYTFNVPSDHYLVMGDNRDNSSDSRVWGFVPDKYLQGKAFGIWLNFSEPSRIGQSIK